MRWVSYAYRSQSACDDDAIDPIPIATNAVKYGALSVPSGRLRVEWSRGEAEIVIRWSEADGPPVKPPSHQGFGTRLVGPLVQNGLEGKLRLDWNPDGSLAR